MALIDPNSYLVQRIKNSLAGRELDVILMRLGVGYPAPLTLHEIGDHFSITRERVRQIQHKALLTMADSELNTILLVESLSRPTKLSIGNRRNLRARNKNEEILAATNKKRTYIEQEFIVVYFLKPVKGEDPFTGDIFNSDRHVLKASWAKQDGKVTLFMNEEGMAVASWNTQEINQIQWPTGEIVPANPTNYDKRMEEIKRKYPKSWSKWSYEEDQQLINEFNSGLSISECCERHGRARGGIVSRLRKLQLISPTEVNIELDKPLNNSSY